MRYFLSLQAVSVCDKCACVSGGMGLSVRIVVLIMSFFKKHSQLPVRTFFTSPSTIKSSHLFLFNFK